MALPILRRGGSPVPVRRADANTQANTMSRLDPWNDFASMDRLFDSFFRSPFSTFDRPWSQATHQAEPQVELYESGDELIAYLYAPGMAADAFDISASADTITIKGERKPLLEASEGLTSHTPWNGLATSGGTFTASYNLPVEIDPAKVTATYKDGVLAVRMAKSEAAKPKQVKVQVS
jgi:HSP20 family protein